MDKEARRRYYRKNRDKILKQQKLWRERNPEKARAIRERHILKQAQQIAAQQNLREGAATNGIYTESTE